MGFLIVTHYPATFLLGFFPAPEADKTRPWLPTGRHKHLF